MSRTIEVSTILTPTVRRKGRSGSPMAWLPRSFTSRCCADCGEGFGDVFVFILRQNEAMMLTGNEILNAYGRCGQRGAPEFFGSSSKAALFFYWFKKDGDI